VRPKISVILPARNESAALAGLLPRLGQLLPEAQVLVVDDGSTDATAAVCATHGVRCIRP
jgi:glycosyltransferase involved in cell wall biosynthesis